MNKTVTIATKVTQETLTALENMAAQRCTSVYDLVLSAIAMLLRIGSKKQALNPRIMQSWHAFEHMYGALSIANIATINQKNIDIQDAIYRVTQKDKKDAILIYMARPFFGKASVDQNNEHIVDLVLRTAYPSTYKMLKEIKDTEGLNSIMGVISHMISTHYCELMERQISEMFMDDARAENTKDLNILRPYKRKRNSGIDKVQTKIDFNDYEQGQELQATDRQPTMGKAIAEDEGI